MRDSISQDDTESLINGYTHPAPGVSASERSIREDSDREDHQQIKDVIKRSFQSLARSQTSFRLTIADMLDSFYTAVMMSLVRRLCVILADATQAVIPYEHIHHVQLAQ